MIYLSAPLNFVSLTPAPPPCSAINSRTLRLSQSNPRSGFQMVVSIVDTCWRWLADEPEGLEVA